MFATIDDAFAFAEKSKWLRDNIPGVYNDVLESLKRRYIAEQALKTDREVFDFLADI